MKINESNRYSIITYQKIEIEKSASYTFQDISSARMFHEIEEDGYYSNNNYRNLPYAHVDGESKYVDISKLLYNPDSYLKGCIDTKDDVDFYSFSLKNVLGYRQIEITIEDIEGYGYELTVYDQYGNQVGIGKRDAEGNIKVTIDSVAFGVNKYYIKVEGKENENIMPNEYHLKMDFVPNDKEEVNLEARNRVVKYIREIYEKEKKGENCDALISELDDLQASWQQQYDTTIEELHEKQYSQYEKENDNTVEELLARKRTGETLRETEEDYLRIFANLFAYEQANAQGEVTKIGEEIKEILKKYGINEFDAISFLWQSGRIIVEGLNDPAICKDIETEINEKYGSKLYQLYLRASEEINALSEKEYNIMQKKQKVNDYLSKISNGTISIEDISVISGKIYGLPKQIAGLVNEPGDNYKYNEIRDLILQIKDFERMSGKKVKEPEAIFYFEEDRLRC